MAITLLWLPLALRAADDLNVQPAANARGRLRICLSLILILLAVRHFAFDDSALEMLAID